MTDSTELYYAEMEAARNNAATGFFNARTSLRDGPERELYRKLFDAGFERAFAPLWHQLQAKRREVSQLASLAGNVMTQSPSLETSPAPRMWAGGSLKIPPELCVDFASEFGHSVAPPVETKVECDCKDYCNGPDTTDRQCRAENGTF